MVSNFGNLIKTLITSSSKTATNRTRLLQLVSASFFSLSATIAHSDSVEITLFEGMVLEVPEDADQHAIRLAFTDNISMIEAALTEKSAPELFELYRLALIDSRLNNPEGNFAFFQSNANALVSVDGYFRSNGTYVAPHFRTSPDGLCFNNFGGC